MAGRVLVAGQRVDKAGHPVPQDAEVRVKGLGRQYVSRGGQKLAAALVAFAVSVRERVILDAGASTGGFTDCLLQNGAARVYAVDVGYGQLSSKLRADRRVANMERTNISDVVPAQLQPRPSLATIDLSYLSLKQAIPIVAPLVEHEGELLCLVKPLFEVSDPAARRTGRLHDPAVFSTILHDLVDHVGRSGLCPAGVSHSPVSGSRGTQEFFLRVCLTRPESQWDQSAEIAAAVAAAAAEC